MSDINEVIEDMDLSKETRAAVRIRELIAKVKALEETNSTLSADLQKISKKNEEMKVQHEKNVEELVKNFSNEKLEMQVTTSISSLGIEDSDAIDFIKHKYNNLKVEEGKEKPSFKDFIEQNKESSFIKNFMPKKEVVQEEVIQEVKQVQETDKKPLTAKEKLHEAIQNAKQQVVDPTAARISEQKPNTGLLDAANVAQMTPAQWKQSKADILAKLSNR